MKGLLSKEKIDLISDSQKVTYGNDYRYFLLYFKVRKVIYKTNRKKFYKFKDCETFLYRFFLSVSQQVLISYNSICL